MAKQSTSRFEESLAPGTPFADRFVVERVLGRGGMGVVFAARHLELDELVAVKVMLPEIAANAETAARFFREARASVRIKSDYVVRVLDVSRLPDGTPYIVMEYLEGIDLDTLLEQEGQIAPAAAARFIIEAADAIAAAHAIGIIHRDLKPQNLFLARQGDETRRIKVLDFGISKISEPLSELDASLTQTSVVMGSPLYMSPEQMQCAKTVDQRSDIWSLGCVLYELVTGKPPFNAPTVPELCAAVFTEPTPLATRARPDLPKAFNAVIARCLEKSPEQRYATVGQFAKDLLPFAPDAAGLIAGINRRRSSMPPPINATIASLGPRPNAAATGGGWGQTTGHLHRRSPRPRRRDIAIAASVVALGSLAYMSLRHGTGASPLSPLATSPSSAAVFVSAPSTRQGSQLEERRAPQTEPPELDAGRVDAAREPLASGAPHASSGLRARPVAMPRVATSAPSAAKASELPSSPTTAASTRAPSLKIDIK
jgi:serine/threonine-protein kinase